MPLPAPEAHQFQFFAELKFAYDPHPDSSALAAGQVKHQVRPEGGYSRLTAPSMLRSAIAFMTMVPNPRRFGADTDGPLRSIQLMVKVWSTVPQETYTHPLSVESAPYFPALVASSWSA